MSAPLPPLSSWPRQRRSAGVLLLAAALGLEGETRVAWEPDKLVAFDEHEDTRGMSGL